MLVNCHVGELSCWRNVMLANCQLVNCHVDELSCWRNVMLANCHVGKMSC
jgi:phosphoribosyl-AMP cyclohydrolase